MSILGRRISIRALAVLVAGMVVCAGGLIPLLSKAPSREITLVAQGMAFYLENDLRTPNPKIEVRAGETVRIVLRNRERGMLHDFAVPALGGASMDRVNWNESGAMTVSIPDEPGTYEYVCRPHQLMMRGVLEVTAD